MLGQAFQIGVVWVERISTQNTPFYILLYVHIYIYTYIYIYM